MKVNWLAFAKTNVILGIVHLGIASLGCIPVTPVNSTSREMKIYALPVSRDVLKDLGLPKSAIVELAKHKNTTDLVFHSIQHDERENAKELFSFLDSIGKIDAIAFDVDEELAYWRVRPVQSGDGGGAVFIPIVLGTRSINRDSYGRTARTALTILEGAFDHIDTDRKPFAFNGIPANELVDFSVEPANSQHEWRNAVALLTTLGGDTLLIKGDDVAWHQIETNRIIPVGELKSAIRRYFEMTLDDEEFCSWNDVP